MPDYIPMLKLRQTLVELIAVNDGVQPSEVTDTHVRDAIDTAERASDAERAALSGHSLSERTDR